MVKTGMPVSGFGGGFARTNARRRALLLLLLLLLAAFGLLQAPVQSAAAPKPYSLEGVLTRGEQVRLDISIKPLSAYRGEAHVVFQLMEGNVPILINAIPLQKDEWEISQYFNVTGPDCKVKVFVFDRFDSDLAPPVPLAEPKVFQITN